MAIVATTNVVIDWPTQEEQCVLVCLCLFSRPLPQAAHPDSLKEAHEAVLRVYRRQVIATRHMQQQRLLSMGDPAGAVMISEDVQPNEYVNDGYIWLALAHHLLGAGQLEQVRAISCVTWAV